MTEQLRSIQVLRGVAAGAVVIIHATASSYRDGPGTFYWGSAGVDLFFVISGFIIGTISVGQTPTAFLWRRLWRIYPLWWVAALPWFLAFGLQRGWLTTATLWPVWDQFVLPLPQVGWTLCFEMLFYVGTTMALWTRPAVPLGIYGVTAIAAQFTANPLIDFIGNPIIAEFLFGLGISRLPRQQRFAPLMIGVGFLALAFSPAFLYDHWTAIDASVAPIRVLVWGLPCALIVAGTLSMEQRFNAPMWSFPVLLGNASYSTYLFHEIATMTTPAPWPIKAGAGIAAGLAAHFLIERWLQAHRPKWPLSGVQRRLRWKGSAQGSLGSGD